MSAVDLLRDGADLVFELLSDGDVELFQSGVAGSKLTPAIFQSSDLAERLGLEVGSEQIALPASALGDEIDGTWFVKLPGSTIQHKLSPPYVTLRSITGAVFHRAQLTRGGGTPR